MKIAKIEEAVLFNSNVLRTLMDTQVLLEKQLQELIKHNNPPTITIRGAKQIDFIPLNEIIYCSADLSYTKIITENHNSILATKSINDFDELFTQHSFFRISKSLLINVNQIYCYNRKNTQVIMKNKDVLTIARRRKADFLNAIS